MIEYEIVIHSKSAKETYYVLKIKDSTEYEDMILFSPARWVLEEELEKLLNKEKDKQLTLF